MSTTAPSSPKQAAISLPRPAGAAVHGYGKLAFDDTPPVPVDASDDALETCERSLQVEDVLTPPPEGVSLLGRAAATDRSRHERREGRGRR